MSVFSDLKRRLHFARKKVDKKSSQLRPSTHFYMPGKAPKEGQQEAQTTLECYSQYEACLDL